MSDGTNPRLFWALLRLPGIQRAALSSVTIHPQGRPGAAGLWAQVEVAAGHGDAFGGPLDSTVPVADQVEEVRTSGLWGSVEARVDGQGIWHVQPWANERQAWQGRVALAGGAPAARDLLAAATDRAYAVWRSRRAEQLLQEATSKGYEAGLTSEEVGLLTSVSGSSDQGASASPSVSAVASTSSMASAAGGAPQGFTPRPYTDRDGVVGWSELVQGEPVASCVVCGKGAAAVIEGLRIHPVCWEGSTQIERAATVPVGHPWARSPQPSEQTGAGVVIGQNEAAATPEVVESSGDDLETLEDVPAGAAAAFADAQESAPDDEDRDAQRAGSDDGVPDVVPGADRVVLPAFTGEYRAAAAVVDLDGIWLSNGEHVELPGEPPAHVGELVRLAQWLSLGTQVTKYLNAPGQVWIGDELAAHMGLDVARIAAAPEHEKDQVAREVTQDSPAVVQAVEAGYGIGGRGKPAMGRWTRVWKGTAKSVWVVLIAATSRDPRAAALLGGDPDHATLARRIGLFATALGHPFQLSGPSTGLDLLFALRHKDRERFFEVIEPCEPAASSTTESDLSWSRKPTGEEARHEWVHGYDRAGSYLAGVSGLELGIGTPEHHPNGRTFDAKTPGYWKVEIPDLGDWRMPHPMDPRGKTVGQVRWVSTPTLAFALEQGYAPDILEAWTWADRTRVLDPWYERIRDARTSLDTPDPDSQIARDQLKQVYAPTIGMFGSQVHLEGKPGYRPDWRHLILAKARTNVLRRVVKIGQDTGRWPVAITADTVLYTSNDPDPVRAWPGGSRWYGRDLGRYKHEGSARMTDHLHFLTGDGYRGKSQLDKRAPGLEL